MKTELRAAQRVAEVIFVRGLARVPVPKDIAPLRRVADL